MALLKNRARSESSGADDLRADGNMARDAKKWQSASDAYKKYLELAPQDSDIWVQYAHALKEQERLTEAEEAYREAARIVSSDAEPRLHLAHLLKRLERPREAAKIFSEVMKLAPSPEIMTELRTLGYDPELAMPKSSPAQKARNGRYIELKDLFQYLSLHVTVTGITRVTLGLVNYILEELDEAEAASYHFVHQYGDGEGVLLITKAQMRRIVHMAMGDSPNLSAMQRLIGEIRTTSQSAVLRAGDLYFIPGAFWDFVDNPSWLGGLKRKGVIIGGYIYDLIPITHAQYCMVSLTDAFTTAFAETARFLDFAFTISAFVAEQVVSYITQHHIASFPTIPVPLAHELRFEAERAKQSFPTSSALDQLDDSPFVLCVCTIEARKNHLYIFNIWQRMLNEGRDVPDLVFVGRPGWRIHDLMDQISSSRNLGGRLHIMSGLSDQDLATLYDRCLFTVFPSFVEGWGLPVGESLAHGKVCVASSTTSIPEVGGQSAIYIDPFDFEMGYKTISELIADPQALAEREANLKKLFVPRTWKDVGEDFFSKLDRVLPDLIEQQATREIYAPSLEAGDILNVEDLGNTGARGTAYVVNPQRLVFCEGWRGMEMTGPWMRERDNKATICLRTTYEPGRALSVLLHIGTSPWIREHNTLRISASGAFSKGHSKDNSTSIYSRSMRPNADLWLRLKGQVDEAGCLTVRFRVDGYVEPSDPTALAFTIRLHAICYAASDDVITRLDLLEQVFSSR